MNLFPVLRIVGFSNVTLNIGQSRSSNIDATPNSNWTIGKHWTVIEWPLYFTRATSFISNRYNCKPIVLKGKNSFQQYISIIVTTATISMFSNDVAMATLRCDIQSFADEKAESRRVEHCSTPKDSVPRKSAQFPRNIRQNIHCEI